MRGCYCPIKNWKSKVKDIINKIEHNRWIARVTTTKVPWFDGTTSWEQYLVIYTKCLRRLCGRMAGTTIQQQCNCSRI